MLRGIHTASRNWLGRIVMGVVLGLIAISFAIWGIGDIFRGFGQSTVAKIGDTEIRVEQFRQLYQDHLQQIGRNVGRPILPEQARALGLDRQLLAQLISETIVDERARDMRLAVTDAEIARRVVENENFKSITGQFDRMRFEQTLRSIGYTEARFLAEQRRILLRQQLIGTVGGELIVPKAMIEAANRYQNEQRSIEYVTLGREQAGEVPAPTPEVLAKYFEERKVVFNSPEYRKITIVVLTPADLAETVEVSDAEIKQAYEARNERYVVPERRHVQQIVFPTMEEARAGAEKIARGTKFAELAAERGLKETDVDLGTIVKTAIVDRAVGDAAFAAKVGEVSAPVDGRFGAALVQVLQIVPAQTKPLEDVSAELKREVATDRARNEVLNVHDKVEDERLSGVALAEAARKFGLKPRTLDLVDRSGRSADGTVVSDLPQGVDVLAAAFSADIGGDNDALRLPGNGYVWFDVSDIKQSRERPLDEIKDQVLARWRDDELASRLREKATAMVDQLKTGKPFGEVAAADRMKVEWRPGIKRGDPATGIPVRVVEEIFRTPKDGADSAEGASPSERIVFRVTEITVPPFDPQASDLKSIEDQVRRAIGEDIVGQYLARLQGQIGVSINQNALNQVTGAAAAN